tara:strand:+ start:644 stop:1084 length:441 start_codon:yes stop_codon:yes gene_type:complete
MKKIFFYILVFCLLLINEINAKENFFDQAKKKFDEKKMEDSKFLFHRNIVHNPKHAQSYLYLAKIYNSEKNEKEEKKNLETTLLLEPQNEEAIYMLINIGLEKSDFSGVKNLNKKLEIVCINLCNKIEPIKKKLKDIEAKGMSLDN